MRWEYMANLKWVQTALFDKDKYKYWESWQREVLQPSNFLNEFSFLPDFSSVMCLPFNSCFLLFIPFRLKKPYLSKDECDFHILDNPLRKEKVFQKPMIAPTSWKGALRKVLWQLGCKENNETTIRLLGNPRDSEELNSGCLYFFPTFFTDIGLEVINPHDRKTGVGKQGPILMECVPENTVGELRILYVPLGLLDQKNAERTKQVAADLEKVTQAVRAMLTTYGFGAKTSSGFGTAENQLAEKGKLVIKTNATEGHEEAQNASEYSFDSLDGLCDVAKLAAVELRNGGDA